MIDLAAQLGPALAGRYVLEREVGRGAMGVVYLARELEQGRAVAVKVLSPTAGMMWGAERFRREIQVLARLRHPRILPLYDSGSVDGLLYYVMPFVEGESLRDRLAREGRLAVADALQIASDVADALVHAHAHDVLHRDIKPANLLLCGARASVCDFGLARPATQAAGDALTMAGVTLGSPAYMSPEQARGESELDVRTDVYSLGCVLYEMLAGQPPDAGTNSEAVMAKRSAGTPPPLRLLRLSAPAFVSEVVMRALAARREDRYPSASAMLSDLEWVRSTAEARSTAP